MLIIAVGINHRTAPVEIREKIAFSERSLTAWLKKLYDYPAVEGCVILSTCNRSEIYISTRELDEGLKAVRDFLSVRSGMDISEIKNYTYVHSLYDAIRHLFRVASGIDSMVLGETQVLGQVSKAYTTACTNGFTSSIINTLFQQAIAVGKRVRSETGIDQNSVSISYVAVEMARQVLGGLEGKKVLIVGAGKMSELAAVHLIEGGITGVFVSNRSYRRAVEMAGQLGGEAIKFDRLFSHMCDADIVISCTAAPHCVIKLNDVKELMARRQGKKIVMIDIAVPRDIEPDAGRIEGVELFDIDDLQNVVDSHILEKKKAAVKAETIIEEELDSFMKRLGIQFVVPTIASLQDFGEAIKRKALARALNRLGSVSDHDRKVVSSMANSIVKQILHIPVIRLKEYALSPEGHLYTEVLQNLFDIDVPGQQPKKQMKAKPERLVLKNLKVRKSEIRSQESE